ncbi:DUF5944 family protein [Streptomyces orinoci]|uniref:DUF5944 family protein n=1 Tax=Streptomyces orinoci TaxID=67339 RepID=A0ABV3JU69_STRON|nr:DUF5944 family protein [Streptomyces orinoci]
MQPPSFDARQVVGMVRKDDFAHTSDIREAFARHVSSRQLPPESSPLQLTVDTQPLGTGIRLTLTSAVGKLTGPATVTHKFFFVDRDECRIYHRTLTPEEPAATSEVLVLFEDGRDRDYCHASVHDGENRLLAVQAVVFDRAGRHVPYPFTSQYVCPLALDAADLRFTRDAQGRRVARFSLSLTGLTGPEHIAVAWEAVGVIHRTELVCTPEQPAVTHDMVLDDNPHLAPGDWVVIAVDDKDRLLAQTLVTLVPATGRPCRP